MQTPLYLLVSSHSHNSAFSIILSEIGCLVDSREELKHSCSFSPSPFQVILMEFIYIIGANYPINDHHSNHCLRITTTGTAPME